MSIRAAERPTKRVPREVDNRLAATVETVLIIIGFAGMLFLLPRLDWGDGSVRYHQLTALLEQGAVPEGKYSMVGPLFSAPLWLIGEIGGSPDWWTLRYNLFLLVGGVVFVWFALRDLLPRPLLRRFILLLIFASMFAHHQLGYNGEMFTAILVLSGSVALVGGRTWPGWLTVAIGVANTPATLPALIMMVAKWVWDVRRLRWVLAVLTAVGLVMAEAWLRRGSPLATGYEGDDRGNRTIMPYSGLPGFSYPIFFGLLSLILSFGKGLLFFAPGLFLPVRQRLRDLAAGRQLYELWLAFVIGLLLLYAMYWSWSGSSFWGPRYLLFAAVPAAFALAVRCHRPGDSAGADLVTVLALGLSIWAGLNGAVFGDVDVPKVCWPDGAGQYEAPICFYTPEFSALWYPFVAGGKPLSTGQWIYLTYGLAVGVYLLAGPLLRLVGHLRTWVGFATARIRAVHW
ncbi:hypothetical protein E1292_16995 [Nonomuraea deserti]|uniref:DUF2029 domain-containing protein n=1 Tax=Nonomuraea deserti TaxID=1848322 RepID=A0A4R4VNJ5_9ACTN|nr:hypothetical protein [Nonomuraea deserti]TDD05567.1 hypothetical protein E1292_16995 [Nonomuraea deserti]